MAKKRNGKNELIAARNRLLNTLRKIVCTKSGKARNEFRYNMITGHKAYVISVDEWADIWIALGLTSSEVTGGVKNMPLSANPQKGKTKASYIRNGEVVGIHSDFSEKPKKGMAFSEKDIPNVKAKKRNAKKNAKRRKKEQKKRK